MRFASPYAAGHGDPHFGRFHLEAENIVSNGGFETNTDGWMAASSATVEQSSEQAHSGDFSLKVTQQGSTTFEGADNPTTPTIIGKQYTGSVYVHAPAGAALRLRMLDLSSSSVLATVSFTGIGDWQRVAATATAIGETTRIQVLNNGSAKAITYYLDDAQVEVGPFATPYIHTDGAAAGRIATRYG